MATPKTQKTAASPTAFIQSLADEERRQDARVLLKLFAEVTGEKPAMWGTAIVGYGVYRATPKGNDWMLVGFSPRKQNLSLYVHPLNIDPKLLKRLGPHSTSMGCLYLKRLADVELEVLRKVIAAGLEGIRAMQAGGLRRGPVGPPARNRKRADRG